MLKADGFDSAIVGYDVVNRKIIYSVPSMIEIMVVRDKISEEEAMEYLEYNCFGAYVGEHTPIYLQPADLEEIEEIVAGEEEI